MYQPGDTECSRRVRAHPEDLNRKWTNVSQAVSLVPAAPSFIQYYAPSDYWRKQRRFVGVNLSAALWCSPEIDLPLLQFFLSRLRRGLCLVGVACLDLHPMLRDLKRFCI